MVYFPITADLSSTVMFSDGSSAETFTMGVEGVSGLAPFLAEMPCAWSVVCKTEGEVYQLPAAILRRQVERSSHLRHLLVRLLADYQAQASIGVACAALHKIEARLAKLLLIRSDRSGDATLHLTQQELSEMLGCQRTTLNTGATHLQTLGAIKYQRGVIRIPDKAVLRGAACECYGLQRSLVAG